MHPTTATTGCGGGGSGGIVMKNMDTTTSPPITYPNINSPNCYGKSGVGFGSGGGGSSPVSVFETILTYYPGSNGNNGFAYIVEDDKFFEYDTIYTPLSTGTYTFILMGGGACGGCSQSTTIGGNGGDSGNISIQKINNITTNTGINITIGKGGKVKSSLVNGGVLKFYGNDAENTTVTFNDRNDIIIALGAKNGDSKSSTPGFQVNGGSYNNNGKEVSNEFINYLNSFN